MKLYLWFCKVPIPEGLDLDEWINPPPADSSSSSDDEKTDLFVANNHTEPERSRHTELTPEEIEQVASIVHIMLVTT